MVRSVRKGTAIRHSEESKDDEESLWIENFEWWCCGFGLRPSDAKGSFLFGSLRSLRVRMTGACTLFTKQKHPDVVGMFC